MPKPSMKAVISSFMQIGKLHKILPAIRILSRVPQHAGNFFTLDIAEKAAHAQAFDEGCHIVFHADRKAPQNPSSHPDSVPSPTARWELLHTRHSRKSGACPSLR